MKAQVNQAFIWVFGIIVMGGIFLLSYSLIDRTIEVGSQADFVRFTNTYKNYLLTHDGYGSYQIERIQAPTGFNKLCVIPQRVGGASDDFIINEYLNSPSDQDTFLLGDSTTVPIGFYNHTNNDEVFCLEAAGGVFNIAFEGHGRKVTLHDPNEETP